MPELARFLAVHKLVFVAGMFLQLENVFCPKHYKSNVSLTFNTFGVGIDRFSEPQFLSDILNLT